MLRLLQSTIRLMTVLRDGDVIDDGRGAVLPDLHLLHGHVAGVVEDEAGVSVLETPEGSPRHPNRKERIQKLLTALKRDTGLYYHLR